MCVIKICYCKIAVRAKFIKNMNFEQRVEFGDFMKIIEIYLKEQMLLKYSK